MGTHETRGSARGAPLDLAPSLPGLEEFAAPKRSRRMPSRALTQARRWLEIAADASINCDCGTCRSESLDHIVQAFEARAGRDLAVLRAIVRLAERGAVESSGAGAIAESAFQALAEIGEEHDLDVLLDFLYLEDLGSYLQSATSAALIAASGEVVLPRLLALIEREADPWRRRGTLDLVAARSDRHPDVLPILLRELDDDPAYGAEYLGEYGDAQALPALRAALGRAMIRAGNSDDDVHTALLMGDAIDHLGGSLDRAERRRIDAIRRRHGQRCAACYPDRAPPPARAEPRTSPNAPCPCGSGRKFKKCCC